MTPTYFKNAAGFRDWLAKNHATEKELLVGFYKKGSGKPSITYPEALDEALAVGWIDGVRRGIEKRSGIYAYEREAAAFNDAEAKQFKADTKAWSFFESQAAWYRRTATHWVANAKRVETRTRRFATLVECSRKGERIPPLTPNAKKTE